MSFSSNDLNLNLGVILTGYTVVMKTYYAEKMALTSSPIIKRLFHTIIVVLKKEWKIGFFLIIGGILCLHVEISIGNHLVSSVIWNK